MSKLVSMMLFMLGLVLVTGSGPTAAVSGADDGSPYDAHDLALMPPYCKYTQVYRFEVLGGNDPAEIARLERLMGPSANGPSPVFSHMHHYCNAIFKTNRATFSTRAAGSEAKIYLKSSIEEFDYVINRAPDTFILLPEILTKKAEALLRLTDGGPPAARTNLVIEQTLTRAIRLKRDYWPAYASLSDYYKRAGVTAKARKVLEDGLVEAPQSPALKRRLTDLTK